MSRTSALDLLLALRDDPVALARYDRRNLAQLVFHARTEGHDLTADDVADVVGALEAHVILQVDGDPFDGTSRLWRRMWGRRHLGYVVEHLLGQIPEAELRALVAEGSVA